MKRVEQPQSAAPSWVHAVILFLLGLGVSLVGIGSKSILLDESASVALARSGRWWLIHSGPAFDPNMRLHYLLLSSWIKVFGDSEVAVRSLSALFAALAVATIYFLGVRLFGRPGGIVAGLLLGANAFLLQYAQNARAYTLLVFLVLLSSYFFIAELAQPSSQNRIWYVLTGGAAIYAHFFAVLVLASHAVALILIRGREAFAGRWVRVALGLLVLSVPAILLALEAGAGAISWIPPPTPARIARALVDFAGKSPFVLVGLVGAGVIATVRAAGTSGSWQQTVLWTWLVLPNLLSLAVSLRHPVYLSSYLIVCVPALILLGVSGLAQISSRSLFVGASAVLVLAAGAKLKREYEAASQEDWRAATNHVLEAASPGDAAVFLPEFARGPFGYYVSRSGRTGPEDITRSRSWDRNRIWLVARESDSANQPVEFRRARDSLAAHHRVAQRLVLPWISLTLYTR